MRGGAVRDLVVVLMIVVVPLGLLMMAVGVLSGVAAGGWNFSWKALQPKWRRSTRWPAPSAWSRASRSG